MGGVRLEDIVSEERAEALARRNLKSQLHPTVVGGNLPVCSPSPQAFLRVLEGRVSREDRMFLVPAPIYPHILASVVPYSGEEREADSSLLPWHWPWHEAFPLFDLNSSCDTKSSVILHCLQDKT